MRLRDSWPFQQTISSMRYEGRLSLAVNDLLSAVGVRARGPLHHSILQGFKAVVGMSFDITSLCFT